MSDANWKIASRLQAEGCRGDDAGSSGMEETDFDPLDPLDDDENRELAALLAELSRSRIALRRGN